MSDVQAWIKETVTQNPVVLFMKGNCPISTMRFLWSCRAIIEKWRAKHGHCECLEDAAVRQGIKEFSNWPTIPQLYINGEFIGGSDIMSEMFENGELQALIKANFSQLPPAEI